MDPLTYEQVAEAFPDLAIEPDPLGHGAFKDAFLARRADDQVVLKIMREPIDASEEGQITLPERAQREIDGMKRVQSPRVVTLVEGPAVRDIGGERRVWYIEPYFAGGTLQVGPEHICSDEHALALLGDLLEAVRALTAVGLVHRDIKPDNIVLDSDGRAVLLDLGIALHEQLTQLTHDQAASPRTPRYAAPEQFIARRDATIDFRTDLFLIGIVVFEARTGRHPFLHPGGTYLDDLFEGRIVTNALAEARVRECLQALMLRLLAVQPNQRYRKLEFVGEALESCR